MRSSRHSTPAGTAGTARRPRPHPRIHRRGVALGAVALSLAVFAGACSTSDPVGKGSGGTGSGNGSGAAQPDARPNYQLASALQPFNACDEVLHYVKSAAEERVGPYGLPGNDRYAMEDSADGAPGSLVPQKVPSATTPATTAVGASGAPAPPTSADGGFSANRDATTTESGAADQSTSGQGGEAATPEHSETNVQEKGVDEPDSIKTDGQRIVAVTSGRLVEVDVRGEAPVNAGSLALPSNNSPQILMQGNHVLVIDSEPAYATYPQPASRGGTVGNGDAEPVNGTLLTLVDISDPATMKILNNTRVDGDFVSARMVDGTARVVTSSRPARLPFVNPSGSTAAALNAAEQANKSIIESSKIEDWLPQVHIGNGSTPTTKPLLDCAKVSHPKTFSGFGVLAVVTVDVGANEVNPADAVGVMADGQTVYASKANLFVATPAYVDTPRNTSTGGTTPSTVVSPAPVALQGQTTIHKFGIEAKGPAVYRASGSVDGDVLNQYSMSEDEGTFRVATTTTNGARSCPGCGGSGVETFVRTMQEVNGELKQIGQAGNMGRGEQVKAVRFVGKQGYVVTFRRTDPLYTLDLSDPANPKVVGELKLLGYSAYLHPMGDDLLLGIGQDATEAGRTLGTKVALYDMSDLANPRELQKYVLWNSVNDVEQDFHAFMWWEPTKLAVVPVDRAYVGYIDGNQYIPPFTGAIGLTVDRNAISELGRIVNPADTRTPQCGVTENCVPAPCGIDDRCLPCPPDAFCSTDAGFGTNGSGGTTTGTAPSGRGPNAVDCSATPCTTPAATAPVTTSTAPAPSAIPCDPACPPPSPVPTTVPKPIPPCPPGGAEAGVPGCTTTTTRTVPPSNLGAPIDRALVIGTTLYTFSKNGVKSSNLADLHERYWLPFFF